MSKKRNTGSESSRRDLARSAVAAYAAAATGLPTKLLARAIPDTSREAPEREQKHPRGWRRNWTIPAEYYTDPERYLFDERLVADHFWLMVDHESRIPDPGDYFVFEYGRSESVIILRDEADAVRAYYNVCRHRGSRLCRHNGDAIPEDPRLSVRQSGQTGNTPVFRCPYHAWTYDLDGKLVYAYGMQEDFDAADNGLIPCHVRTADGFIFVNLSRESEPPEFDSAIEPFRRKVGQRHGTAQLKVGERVVVPMHANWKLALENFLECYHCGPSHQYLCDVHPGSDLTVPGKRVWWAEDFVSGTMDGKPAAPLLPAIKRVRVTQSETATGFSSSYWLGYDDYVLSVRFTPRDVDLTDVECLWLVHPDAKRDVDYDPDRLKELWLVTLLEDIWLCENNHAGIRSGAYQSGRYGNHELGKVMPAGFIRWYMAAVAGEIGPALPY